MHGVCQWHNFEPRGLHSAFTQPRNSRRCRRTETNRRARFYTLTAAGRKQLGLEVSQFRQIVAAISRVLENVEEAG